MAFKFLSSGTLDAFIALIKSALNDKVEKQDGMGLSERNYTNVDKAKVDSIQANAQPNVIEHINLVATPLVPDDNKIVTIPLASASRDGIMSKAHYSRIENMDRTINNLIRDSISDIAGISYEVVTTLPDTGAVGVIYLIEDVNGKGDNIYKEYIWLVDKYESLGTTEIDVSGKVDTSDLVEITGAEVSALWGRK